MNVPQREARRDFLLPPFVNQLAIKPVAQLVHSAAIKLQVNGDAGDLGEVVADQDYNAGGQNHPLCCVFAHAKHVQHHQALPFKSRWQDHGFFLAVGKSDDRVLRPILNAGALVNDYAHVYVA